MNRARLREILAAYGGEAHNWPEQERRAALRLLEEQPTLAAELREAQALDRLLEAVPADEPAEQLIRQTLQKAATLHPPATWSERVLNWLWPEWKASGAQLWRPATALALPFVLGIVVGVGEGVPNLAQNQPASLADAELHWALEMQVAGLALPDEEEGFWP